MPSTPISGMPPPQLIPVASQGPPHGKREKLRPGYWVDINSRGTAAAGKSHESVALSDSEERSASQQHSSKLSGVCKGSAGLGERHTGNLEQQQQQQQMA